MRHSKILAVAAAATLMAAAQPALALDRLAPLDGGSVAVRAADLDRPALRGAHRARVDSYWHWHYRAAYTRWLHLNNVRAGYPVRR